jgi:ABC-type uncharacterized transport system permease subunit
MNKTRKVRWQFHLIIFSLPLLCLSLAILIDHFEETTGKGMSFFFAILSYYFAAFAALYGIILLLAWLVRTLQSRPKLKSDTPAPTNRSAEQDADRKPDNVLS